MYYLVISSVTTAQRLQRLCRKRGIGAMLSRTPQELSERGCSYTLILSEADYPTAMLLAKENGLSLRACFWKDGNGEFSVIF